MPGADSDEEDLSDFQDAQSVLAPSSAIASTLPRKSVDSDQAIEESSQDGKKPQQPKQAEAQPGSSGTQAVTAGGQQAQQDDQPPTEADFEGWPDDPLLLRPLPSAGMQVQQLDKGRVRVNSQPIAFDSELFRGWVVVQVLGLPSSPPDLFKGKRRRTSFTFQGRFQRELSADSVQIGQDFARPAKNLPARWLLDTVLIQLARSINPSLSIGPMSKPFVLATLLSGAQEAHMADPGEAPDPQQPVTEDLRLMSPKLATPAGEPLPVAARQRYFRNAANRRKHSFDTDHVYTFTAYQHVVNMGSYELNLFRRWELASRLDGQPMQFMAKDRDSGKFLFNFEAWHRVLLPAAAAAYDRQS